MKDQIKDLLTQIAEEQIEAMTDHIARELAAKEDGKLSISLGCTLLRGTKTLSAEGGMSFNRKFSLTKTQCSADIDTDQAKLDLK